MPKITPKMFIEQWMAIPSKFEVNVSNFEVTIAKETKDVFVKSFFLGHFNSSGETMWAKRSNRNKKTHPILNETGQLKNSIKWEKSTGKHGVKIFTDPSAFNYIGHRNQGHCYAAVHNAPNGTYVYGRSNVPSIRRQFIGYSTYARDIITKYNYKIFYGFPK